MPDRTAGAARENPVEQGERGGWRVGELRSGSVVSVMCGGVRDV